MTTALDEMNRTFAQFLEHSSPEPTELKGVLKTIVAAINEVRAGQSNFLGNPDAIDSRDVVK
jgi:hypothetical protein